MRSVLVAMLAVAIAFAVVIGLGLSLRERMNAVPDLIFAIGAVAAIFVIAMTLTCLMLGISPLTGWGRSMNLFGPQPFPGRRAPAEEPEWRPSLAQIAYSKDRNATVTCAHLKPIEKAMRMAGITVQLLEISELDPIIKADCRINDAELRRVFQLPPSVYYAAELEPQRSEFDKPRADVFCGCCSKSKRGRCDIQVLHPHEWREDTPWFPTPP